MDADPDLFILVLTHVLAAKFRFKSYKIRLASCGNRGIQTISTDDT